MNYIKKTIVLLLFTATIAQYSFAQSLTLDDAYNLAKKNYPVIKKNDLIKKTTDFTLQNVSKAYLPQISVTGQATYQSDVTSIPVAMPGIKEMSKDQYKIQAEISQLIYDGGNINAQKELIKANEAVQMQSLEVTMQNVNERITDIYFGILMLDEQLKQNNLRRESLNSALKKAEAAYANGVSYKSNVNELKAELLQVDMGDIDIKSNQQAYKDMLGELIGQNIGEGYTFSYPHNISFEQSAINRPELKLYDLQKNVYDAQKKKYNADWMPKVSAFVNGGYGRPGLNMLNNDFSPFAIGGIRVSFPINSLYTYKNNIKIAELNQQQLDIDKENFILNNNFQSKQKQREIEKYAALINEDDKIIELRQSVTQSAQAQLDNNVITVSEFINKLNAEHLARQTKYLHQLQLLKAKYNLSQTLGN